jgi:hypothetical protein
MVRSVIIPSAWGRMQCLLVYVCTYSAIWGAPTDGGVKEEIQAVQIFPSQTFYFHFNPLSHRRLDTKRNIQQVPYFHIASILLSFNPLPHRRLGTKGNTTCVMFSHRKHSTFILTLFHTDGWVPKEIQPVPCFHIANILFSL